MTYTVATRSSALARYQTDVFISAYSAKFSDRKFVVQDFLTRGDQTSGSITNLKNAFAGELETAVIEGRSDCAVHSLKDLSVDLPDSLVLGAVLTRDDPRDMFLSARYSSLSAMPRDAIVGTSSARRCAQIRAQYPDLVVRECRGNVPTRLQKLTDGDYDAIVLASAGVDRLNAAVGLVTERLSLTHFTPACGQGVIAVQCRANDLAFQEELAQISHQPSLDAVLLEREIVRRFGAHCGMPLGVHVAVQSDSKWDIYFFLGDLSGQRIIQRKESWSVTDIEQGRVMDEFVQSILKSGGQEILDLCRRELI